jgi:hypothetical protein
MWQPVLGAFPRQYHGHSSGDECAQELLGQPHWLVAVLECQIWWRISCCCIFFLFFFFYRSHDHFDPPLTFPPTYPWYFREQTRTELIFGHLVKFGVEALREPVATVL